jgi:hypothetical protein
MPKPTTAPSPVLVQSPNSVEITVFKDESTGTTLRVRIDGQLALKVENIHSIHYDLC